MTPEKIETDRRILELLAQNFPNVAAASTEIINLEAILNLPKGTEHFVADIHGEHRAFRHILKNASGNIKRKVTELYANSLSENEIRQLCSLIYYPEEKLDYIASNENNIDAFARDTLPRLVAVLRSVSSKYTRSKVRKALPKDFAYIIEEMLHESADDEDKDAYFRRIIDTIISTGRSKAFIIAICNVIQRLSIDQLHILGDVYDRGPGAHLVMDTLCQRENFDFQWGNHDALWMGAAAGNAACIANVLRISLRYGNMATLEDGYGINLVPLVAFALDTYGDDPCTMFQPILDDDTKITEKNRHMMAQMHKAISIIQFKLEAALIDKHPEWNMADRKLFEHIDYEAGTINLYGTVYPLIDNNFPTIDPANPYALTPEEAELMRKIVHSFRISDKLLRHIMCIFNHGCMYTICNSNLLFHASMPLNADGTLKEVTVAGKPVKGRALLSRIGSVLRDAFNSDTPAAERDYSVDFFWYLWCGPDSPLFDKSRMTTFERYFIADKATHTEEKGNYFKLRNNPAVVDYILDEFGVTGPYRHIINGHVPVRLTKGETPIRAEGKLMVIDGGFAQAYHRTTGMAGYTLVFHSRGFQLVKHEPFSSVEEAVRNGTDIVSTTEIVELSTHRMRVRDTDKGRELQGQIDELRELLYAYRHGLIKEKKK